MQLLALYPVLPLILVDSAAVRLTVLSMNEARAVRSVHTLRCRDVVLICHPQSRFGPAITPVEPDAPRIWQTRDEARGQMPRPNEDNVLREPRE